MNFIISIIKNFRILNFTYFFFTQSLHFGKKMHRGKAYTVPLIIHEHLLASFSSL